MVSPLHPPTRGFTSASADLRLLSERDGEEPGARAEMNGSQEPRFTLTAYRHQPLLQQLLFMLALGWYAAILGANLLLVVVICVNRSLHEPMYMFLCSLFVNELYGSTGLFPLILVQLLADAHTVAAPLCFLQIFTLYSYGGAEYLTLAVMSYDRYLAICCPLHYGARMTARRVAALIALTWLYPCALCVVMVCMSSSLRRCGDAIDKVYCDNFSVVRLACADTAALNAYGLFANFVVIGGTLALILASYARIFRVCFCGSRETRQKAVSTCSPQIASIVNFTFGASFETLQSRFDMSGVPAALRVFLSLYWLTCQPLFNPAVYGLQLSKIRLGCRKLLLS